MTCAFRCNFKNAFSVLNLWISVSYISTKRSCREYLFDTVDNSNFENMLVAMVFDYGLRLVSPRSVSIPNGHEHWPVKICFTKASFESKAIRARSLVKNIHTMKQRTVTGFYLCNVSNKKTNLNGRRLFQEILNILNSD